jgi:hypothetical protein
LSDCSEEASRSRGEGKIDDRVVRAHQSTGGAGPRSHAPLTYHVLSLTLSLLLSRKWQWTRKKKPLKTPRYIAPAATCYLAPTQLYLLIHTKARSQGVPRLYSSVLCCLKRKLPKKWTASRNELFSRWGERKKKKTSGNLRVRAEVQQQDKALRSHGAHFLKETAKETQYESGFLITRWQWCAGWMADSWTFSAEEMRVPLPVPRRLWFQRQQSRTRTKTDEKYSSRSCTLYQMKAYDESWNHDDYMSLHVWTPVYLKFLIKETFNLRLHKPINKNFYRFNVIIRFHAGSATTWK